MSIRHDIELVSGSNAPGWSIADELALDALPDVTRRLVAKALVHRPRTADGTDAPASEQSLADAWKAGWEQGVEDFEMSRPHYYSGDNPHIPAKPSKRGAA